MIEACLRFLWPITVQSSVLIAVVVLLRGVFASRLDKRLQYALWLPVLVRLMLPFSFEGPFGVTSAAPPGAGSTGKTFVMDEAAAQIVGPAPVGTPAQNALPPSGAPTVAAPFPWGEVIVWTWIAGVVAVAAVTLFVNLRFWAQVSKARAPMACRPLLGELCAQLGIKHRPQLFVSDRVGSPCVVGLWRPCIILTPSATADQAALRYILLHELTHIKKADNITAVLRAVCCAVYWYNPLVWLASYLSHRDCELACDASVTRRLDRAQKQEYGMALISQLRRGVQPFTAIQTAATLTMGKKEMPERIKMIMKNRKTAKWVCVCIALALCVAISLTACISATPSENAPDANAPSIVDPAGETSTYSHSGFSFEVTGVVADRTETVKEDDGSDMSRTVITYLPGAVLTVLSADMSDPAVSEDGMAHPQWCIYTAADECIPITDDFASYALSATYRSIFGMETSMGHTFRFEQAGIINDTVALLPEPSYDVCIEVRPVEQHGRLGYYLPDAQTCDRLRSMIGALRRDDIHEDMRDYIDGHTFSGVSVCCNGEHWAIYSGGLVVGSEWSGEVRGMLDTDEALCELVLGLVREELGMTPFFDPAAIKDIVSATYDYAYRERESMENGEYAESEPIRGSQTVTDLELLAELEELLRSGKDLGIGGAGCPFDNVLTLTLKDGSTARMAVATDSCAVFLVDGRFFSTDIPDVITPRIHDFFDQIPDGVY